MKNFSFVITLSLFTSITSATFASDSDNEERQPNAPSPGITFSANIDLATLHAERIARQAARNPQGSQHLVGETPLASSPAVTPIASSTVNVESSESLTNDESSDDEDEQDNVRAPLPTVQGRLVENPLEKELNKSLFSEEQSDEELARALENQQQLFAALSLSSNTNSNRPFQSQPVFPLVPSRPQASTGMLSTTSAESDEELAARLQAEEDEANRAAWEMEKQKYVKPAAVVQDTNASNPWLIEKVAAVMNTNYSAFPLTSESIDTLSEIVTADINVGRTGNNVILPEAVKAILRNQLNTNTILDK